MNYALALFVLAQVCTNGQTKVQVAAPIYGPTPTNMRTPRPTTTPAVWGYWLCQGGVWVAQQPYPPDGVPPRADIGINWPANLTWTPVPTATPPPPTPLPLPAPWLRQDIGAVAIPGYTGFAAGVFSVTGDGTDIYGTSDSFQFAYQSASGDATITVRVATQQNTDVWAKAGVMFRASLGANVPEVSILSTPTSTNGATFQYRLTAGGGSTSINLGGSGTPRWLRLSRVGDVFTGSTSTDGVAWTVGGSVTLPMTSPVLVGMAVTSHNGNALCKATMDNVAVTVP